VRVHRNGLRGIAFGTGFTDQLELPDLPVNADIREGDLLVTSGLGGRYPEGLPAAIVTQVVRDPTDDFARITARPTAMLDRSREVLLVVSQPELKEETQAPDSSEPEDGGSAEGRNDDSGDNPGDNPEDHPGNNGDTR